MSNPLRFSMEFGRPDPASRPAPGQPLRILLMTDLGETCNSRADRPAETRPIVPMDIDRFEDYLEAERPSLSTDSGGIEIRELEDFHPDQIFRVLPEFQKLKDLKRRLKSASSFEVAAQEVRAMLQDAPAAEAPGPEPSPESDDDTLSRLFGKSSGATTTPTAQAPQSSFLTGLIQKAVADHIVAESDPRAEHYVAAIDAAATTRMRAILHDPGFQALEASWRGLDMLISQVETDEELQIFLWNVSKAELVEALGPEDSEAAQSLLFRRLVEQREEAPFSLLVSDIAFGPAPDDLRLLDALGALAGRTGAAVLASLTPEMVGATSWQALADAPESLGAPDVGWTALRAGASASQIAVFAPRFLMRTPYGKRLDPVEAFPFEELERPAEDQAGFLWGAPALLATALIAQSYSRDGWAARLNANRDYGDLPLVSYEADGVPQMKPCAEALLPERAAESLVRLGPVPLVAMRNGNAVRLPWFQTIADGDAEGRLGPFAT